MNYSNLTDSKIKSPSCINQYQPQVNNYSTGKFTNTQISVPKARLKLYMKRKHRGKNLCSFRLGKDLKNMTPKHDPQIIN